MTPGLPDTLEHWPLDRLIPYARNARTHADDQVAQIAASIVEFGWTNPILVDAEGVVVAGHGRLLAARQLGIDTVPVVVLGHLTSAQRRAYVIADNKLALNAGWNEELLAAELHALNGEGFDLALTGFSDAELEALMAPLGDEGEGSDGDSDTADETPAPPRQPVSRAGDLWLLGRHRLICGSSTDVAVVSRVMEGTRASLVFTSPPYGNQRDYTTGGVGDWDALMQGVFAGLPVTDEVQVLVNLGLIHRDNEWQPYWQSWLEWMGEQGWRRFGLYAWDQGPGLPGDWNGRLAPAFELLFHFNRMARKPNKIVPCKWAGHINDTHGGMRSRDGHVGAWSHAGQGVQEMRIPDSVVRITRHKARGIETEHPAVFPVALHEFVMRAYSDDGDVVYEPFAGSGTSLIAGERTGRVVKEDGVDLELLGFGDDELDRLLDGLDGEVGANGEDDVSEPPTEAVTRPGDLWLLGAHRLLCGDATVVTDVERLLDGKRPHLMVTDPPYGVEYDPNWRNEAGVSATARTGKVSNDDRADWREAWSLFPGDAAYVWHSGVRSRTVAESLEACDFKIRAQIIWAKPRLVLGAAIIIGSTNPASTRCETTRTGRARVIRRRCGRSAPAPKRTRRRSTARRSRSSACAGR